MKNRQLSGRVAIEVSGGILQGFAANLGGLVVRQAGRDPLHLMQLHDKHHENAAPSEPIHT